VSLIAAGTGYKRGCILKYPIALHQLGDVTQKLQVGLMVLIQLQHKELLTQPHVSTGEGLRVDGAYLPRLPIVVVSMFTISIRLHFVVYVIVLRRRDLRLIVGGLSNCIPF